MTRLGHHQKATIRSLESFTTTHLVAPTIADIAKDTGRTGWAVWATLRGLEKRGIVTSLRNTGVTSRRPHRTWRFTNEWLIEHRRIPDLILNHGYDAVMDEAERLAGQGWDSDRIAERLSHTRDQVEGWLVRAGMLVRRRDRMRCRDGLHRMECACVAA